MRNSIATCPLRNDWKKWSEEKKHDRLFMICPHCGIMGYHVRLDNKQWPPKTKQYEQS